jgi:glycine cleavage system regulatory protein
MHMYMLHVMHMLCMHLLIVSLTPVYRRRVHGSSQNVKLPLHYAVAKGVSFEVTKLLLEANLTAAAATDKARSSAHTSSSLLLTDVSHHSPTTNCAAT